MSTVVERNVDRDVVSVGGPSRPPGRWVFFGADALPDDPTARLHERRGRRWLVLSYLLCPCHIPITLALIGAVLGGSALGAVLTGNAVRVAVVLTSLYGVVLWRGFRQIRIAKRLEASGRTLICTPTGCDAGSTRDETDVGVARQNWTS